jgi:NAD(P)-dependent dehydrogenase (short-subunit alcohol dehydrogenase family)
VVLAARNSEALDEAVVAIRNKGGEATALDLDIADEGAAEKLLAHALETFGRVDTWVNDAAAAIYARLEQVSMEEHRRVFDVGYFGLVKAAWSRSRHLPREWRSADQRRLRPVQPRHPAAGALLRDEGGGDAVHRHAADGAGAGGRAHRVTLIKPAASTPCIPSMPATSSTSRAPAAAALRRGAGRQGDLLRRRSTSGGR